MSGDTLIRSVLDDWSKASIFWKMTFFPGDVSVQGRWMICSSFQAHCGPSPLVGVALHASAPLIRQPLPTLASLEREYWDVHFDAKW